MSCNFFSCL